MNDKRAQMEQELKNMTSEQKRSSLEAQFWNDNIDIDENSPFMRKIKELWNESKK